MTRSPIKGVLMICYHFPPANNGGVERSVKFAKYLPEYGFKPIVVTTNVLGTIAEKGNGWVIYTSGLARLYRQFLKKGVRGILQQGRRGAVHSVTSSMKGLSEKVIDWTRKWFMIPDNQIGWIIFAFWPSWRVLRNRSADIIYTTSPPESSHLLGLILRKLTGKPWVMDLRDPWTYEPLKKYLRASAFRLSVEIKLERQCFMHADTIILNTIEMTERYKSLYPDFSDKMRTITNGFDAEEMRRAAVSIEQSVPSEMKDNKIFVISHAGTFARDRSKDPTPNEFLDALKSLYDDHLVSSNNCRVIFAGPPFPKTVKRISDLGLDNLIDVLGIISHFDALKLMLRSDLLLLVDRDDDGKTYVRGKLYEYLGSNKMILGIVPDGASRVLLKQSGHGYLVFPKDTEGIRQALLKVLQSRPIPRTNIAFPLMAYERKRLTEELATILNSHINLKNV